MRDLSGGVLAGQDYSKALDWCNKAAKQKSAIAMFYLASAYQRGLGVSIDPKLALNWYKKAALGEYGPAMSNLGGMYAGGQGTKRDVVTAYMWYLLADSRQVPAAKLGLQSLQGQLSKKQIARAQQQAYAWQRNHELVLYVHHP